MDAEEKPSFVLFGRDILRIPCLRTALLYSISSYVGVGLTAFLFTSKPALSSHMGFTAFIVVSFGYYMNCRLEYSRSKFEVAHLQEALQRAAILEGTEEDKTESRPKLENV